MEVTVATTTITLVFKAEIHIRPNPVDLHCLLVGHLSIPKKFIRTTEDPSVVELERSCRMFPGEYNIPSLGGLQRCIFCPDVTPLERCYIPSDFLLAVTEE